MNNDPQNRRRDPLLGQGPVQPPIQPGTDGYYGNGNDARDLPPADWQREGYHLEDQPCDDDDAWVVDDQTDALLGPPEDDDTPPVDPALDVDPISDAGRRDEQSFRADAFWDRVTPESGAVPRVGEEEQPEEQKPEETAGQISGPHAPMQAQAGRRTVVTVLAVLLAVIAAALVGARYVLRIDTVEIVGNSRFTDEEVRSIAGLQPGMGRFEISEDAVKANIASNHYLQFVSLSFGDHSATLTVHERVAIAYTDVLGIYYTLDSRGMVLEEYTDASGLEDLVLVDKLSVSSCIPTQYITFRSSETLNVYIQLMIEIRAMDLQQEIRSVNIDDLTNISLYTRDGYFVHLGDETYLHGKLNAMLLVLQELRSSGEYESGGTIDVSNRAYPTYDPPGS